MPDWPARIQRLDSQVWGLSGTNLLSRWKREQPEQSDPVASALDARVLQLEGERIYLAI